MTHAADHKDRNIVRCVHILDLFGLAEQLLRFRIRVQEFNTLLILERLHARLVDRCETAFGRGRVDVEVRAEPVVGVSRFG